MKKQPRRPHFIQEWAAANKLKQIDVAESIGADKGLVSRWFAGSTPNEHWQGKLAELFCCAPNALFRDPDEQWFVEFLANRSPEEVKRIKETLFAAFPKKQ